MNRFKLRKKNCPIKMQLATKKLLCITSILILFFSCRKDVNTTIINSPTDLPNPKYQINLQSINSGDSLNEVTITWNDTGFVELRDNTLIHFQLYDLAMGHFCLYNIDIFVKYFSFRPSIFMGVKVYLK